METPEELRSRLFSDVSRPYQMQAERYSALGGASREMPAPDPVKMGLDVSVEQVYQLARIADSLEKIQKEGIYTLKVEGLYKEPETHPTSADNPEAGL